MEKHACKGVREEKKNKRGKWENCNSGPQRKEQNIPVRVSGDGGIRQKFNYCG